MCGPLLFTLFPFPYNISAHQCFTLLILYSFNIIFQATNFQTVLKTIEGSSIKHEWTQGSWFMNQWHSESSFTDWYLNLKSTFPQSTITPGSFSDLPLLALDKVPSDQRYQAPQEPEHSLTRSKNESGWGHTPVCVLCAEIKI